MVPRGLLVCRSLFIGACIFVCWVLRKGELLLRGHSWVQVIITYFVTMIR